MEDIKQDQECWCCICGRRFQYHEIGEEETCPENGCDAEASEIYRYGDEDHMKPLH